MKKTFLTILLLLSVGAFGESYLVYDAPPALARELRDNFGASDVFSVKEKEFLSQTNVNPNVLKLNLNPRELKSLTPKLGTDKKTVIETNPLQEILSADPYESFQWALDNNGDDLIEWESDIDVLTTTGLEGEDIGAAGIEEVEGNRIRVAVIDSGVDVEHPDLKGQILSKPKECAALREYTACMNTNPDRESCHETYANFDSDGNGYPMDCNGWNLDTADIPGAKVSGGPKIYDRDGHGTHIAGIIAAKRNKQGITGVIQNVSIIPVQVGVTSASGDKKEAPTDKIAKAILYAVQAKAQIINLSLGWRFDQDSLLMRQMIEHAKDSGVLIVAAAGNDAHEGPVYPCSYEGVICVASHTVNGELSSFSNYGAHVDVAAPGTKILSAWPKNKRSRFFTQEDSYEYLSGTSQAAPHVAGVLARLLNLGFSPEESLVKMLKGSREFRPGQGKLLRNGKVDLKKALQQTPGPFIYLSNKSAALVKWDENSEERSFVLKLENLGRDAKNVKVRIESVHLNDQDSRNEDQRVDVITKEIALDQLNSGEKAEKRITFSSPYEIHGEFLFSIHIVCEGKESRYFLQAKAVNIVDGETEKSNQRIFDLLDANNLEGASINKFLNHTSTPGTDLLASKSVNGSTFLSLLRQTGDTYEQSEWQKIPVANPVLLNLSKVDVDQDASPDYVATIVSLEDKERETNFFVFDENFQAKETAISPGNKYDNKLAVMPGGFKWARNRGRMVPAWIGVGERPQSERPEPGPWDPIEPELKINRLYLLTAQGVKTVPFEGEEEFPLHLLYQSQASKVAGKITIITGDSFGYYKRYSTYSFESELVKLNAFELFPYIDLLNAKPLPLANAAGENAFFSEKSLDGARVVSIDIHKGVASIKKERLSPFSPKNPIERVLSFDGTSAIYQTRHHLASGASSIPSKTGAQRIKHEILTTMGALYLRSSLSPGLTGELVSLTSSGKLQRSARWLTLGVNGCSEVGFSKEETSEYLVYACPELGKILKFQLTK